MKSTLLFLVSILFHSFIWGQYNFNLYSGWDPDIPLESVYDLDIGPNSQVWVVNQTKIVRFDGNFWFEYDPSNCAIPMSSYNKIVVIDDDLWVSTPENGLYKMDILGNSISYNISNSGLLNDSIVDLVKNSQDHLILKTRDGLMNFDGSNTWIDIDISALEECNKIDVDINDNIWCTQPEGPAQYITGNWLIHDTIGNCPNLSNNLITTSSFGVFFCDGQEVTKYDGSVWSIVPTNAVPASWMTSLLSDENGDLWLNITDGGFPETAYLYHFNGDFWTHATAMNNPYEPEFWAGDLTKAPNGSIWSSLAKDLIELTDPSSVGGLLNIKQSDLKIFPNPTSNFININSDLLNIEFIKVTDLMGNLVLFSDQHLSQVYIGTLNKGAYFLLVKVADGRSIIEKFIIN